MSGFRHLGDEEVARLNRYTLVQATFQAPDGSTFRRDVVRSLGVAAVVPLSDDGESVLLVRQYRGPIDRLLLEIPAGICDIPGEPAIETARRELMEEAGRTSEQFDLLAAYYQGPGFSDQHVSIYLATGLTEVPTDRQGPEEEAITLETVPLAEVPAMIAAGELIDSKTIIGLFLVRERLRT